MGWAGQLDLGLEHREELATALDEFGRGALLDPWIFRRLAR